MSRLSKQNIKAIEASQLLDNPIMVELFTSVRAELNRDMEKTLWCQNRKRAEIWRTLNNLTKIENYLNRIITTGKMNKLK